ncbi:MAG: hypothetical protein JWL86_200 [Rhizobium sp.]|nr:hypothetical protein [Rhizobium sp.]
MPDDVQNADEIYFFRVFTDGVERHRTDGIAFPTKEEAWHEASTSSGEILREMDGKMHTGMDWRMDVLNASGDLIYRLSFRTEKF